MVSRCCVTEAGGELHAIGPDPWGCLATGVLDRSGSNRAKPGLLGEGRGRVSFLRRIPSTQADDKKCSFLLLFSGPSCTDCGASSHKQRPQDIQGPHPSILQCFA